MSFLSSIQASASGLTAQRLRMDVISNNLANVDTTHTPEGGPYRRQHVVFSTPTTSGMTLPPAPASSGLGGQATAGALGVRVAAVVEDKDAVRVVRDPTHPDADAQGNVQFPDIDVVAEMVDMLSASRAYEANVTALNAAKSMALRALDIGR